jgi:hypothetical protein
MDDLEDASVVTVTTYEPGGQMDTQYFFEFLIRSLVEARVTALLIDSSVESRATIVPTGTPM